MKLFLDVSPNAIKLWKAEEGCLLKIEVDCFGKNNFTFISFCNEENYFIDIHTYSKFVRELNRHQTESLKCFRNIMKKYRPK